MNDKSKAAGESKEPKIPAEWVGMTIEELRSLVAQCEFDLEGARGSRNKAQVEHTSIQSYYDVTREEIRKLDMLIEKKDLEIEHAEEDNASELLVYKQKANFIKYCHDTKMKEIVDQNDTKMKNDQSGHVEEVRIIEDVKTRMTNDLIGLKAQKANEISDLQQTSNSELALVKEKLEADVKLFAQRCDDQYLELIRELDLRRDAELKLINARRESHTKNLKEAHQNRCNEMRKYYEGVKTQQEKEIEDLEAEMLRLKKAAIENESKSCQLKDSNQLCEGELKKCSEIVATLTCETRDKEKNATSLRSTNLRLKATRKATVEARIKYKQLQEKFNATVEERNILQEGVHDVTSNIFKSDATKAKLLRDELESRKNLNAIIQRHLQHTLSSAGLDTAKSDALLSSMQEFIEQNDRDMEKLFVAIFRDEQAYDESLRSCRSELEARGVLNAQIDMIDVLNRNDNEGRATHSKI
ncbi:hypothetical protein ACHAXA_006834 [Cyclostephanos tholiformis]|uniref:Growth arrest-specific protein 8 domain-containing protein n=1 Tax=Cyclostephanos tholiformis TaxID=382380 RepID=A0ABD3RCR3_9STRA